MNIIMAQEKYAKSEFEIPVSTDASADAASCSTLASFLSTPEESRTNI